MKKFWIVTFETGTKWVLPFETGRTIEEIKKYCELELKEITRRTLNTRIVSIEVRKIH